MNDETKEWVDLTKGAIRWTNWMNKVLLIWNIVITAGLLIVVLR